ncbi:hypothetical protein Aduo_016345 [Ancylostoma duodenale]
MKSLLFLSLVSMSNAFCCAPVAFTSCCMAYAPPTIVGYQRIPIFARVPKRRLPPPVEESYQAPPPPPPPPVPQQYNAMPPPSPPMYNAPAAPPPSDYQMQSYQPRTYLSNAPNAKKLRL